MTKSSAVRLDQVRETSNNNHSTMSIMENETQENWNEDVYHRALTKSRGLLVGLFGAYMAKPYGEYYAKPWDTLVSMLIVEDSLDQFRTQQEFKKAVYLAHTVNEQITKTSHLDYGLDLLEEKEFAAVKKLLEIIPIGFGGERADFWDMDAADIFDLEEDLKTIMQAQEMVLRSRRGWCKPPSM